MADKASNKRFTIARDSLVKVNPTRWPWEERNAKSKKADKRSTSSHSTSNKTSDKRKK